MDFGDPEAEAGEALQGNVLADLSYWGIIRVAGRDAATFLSGQFTCDVRKVSDETSLLGSWCTPKGKVMVVFRLLRHGDAYHLLLPRELLESTLKRLRMYVLRANVALADHSDALARIGLSGPSITECLAEAGYEPPASPNQAHQGMGGTLIRLHDGLHPRYLFLSEPEATKSLWLRLGTGARPVGTSTWDMLEILAGVPTILPATTETFLPQMLNLKELGGISFTKGCYVGQEVVAKLEHLGKLKRRMVLASVDTENLPEPGAPVFHAGEIVGQVLSAAPHPEMKCVCLAVLEKAAIDAVDLRLEGAPLSLLPLPYPIQDPSERS
jgi:folate-binding protein YgfZ